MKFKQYLVGVIFAATLSFIAGVWLVDFDNLAHLARLAVSLIVFLAGVAYTQWIMGN